MPKRTLEHMQAQRERILRAAIRCIGDRGLERTSIAAICETAELSTGAIYKHFKSKDEIVDEALRFAALDEAIVPANWMELRRSLAGLEDECGFDIETVAGTNLQLLASSLRPGPLQTLLKPKMDDALQALAKGLEAMEKSGQIVLKMTPLRTAMCITALADGLTWVGLASNRPKKQISSDIAAGLDCLVEARPC